MHSSPRGLTPCCGPRHRGCPFGQNIATNCDVEGVTREDYGFLGGPLGGWMRLQKRVLWFDWLAVEHDAQAGSGAIKVPMEHHRQVLLKQGNRIAVEGAGAKEFLRMLADADSPQALLNR